MAGQDPRSKLRISPVSAAAPGTLYDQVVTGLKREISEGRLTPGAALPSFRVLAEELLVSVITVKRAYEELEREGIIYRRQGLGTFVSAIGTQRMREVALGRARDLLSEAVRVGTEAGVDEKGLVQLLRKIIDEHMEPRYVRKRH
jgi:GntR family transcriptional regulator